MTRIDGIIVLFWFVPVALQIVLPLAMLLGYGFKRMFAAKTDSQLAPIGSATARHRPPGAMTLPKASV